eukprot:4545241-Pyramimonas_sp.AAC.1
MVPLMFSGQHQRIPFVKTQSHDGINRGARRTMRALSSQERALLFFTFDFTFSTSPCARFLTCCAKGIATITSRP